MKICPVWGFCECGNDLHRSVQDASHTNSAWHGFLFRKKLRSHTGGGEDYAM